MSFFGRIVNSIGYLRELEEISKNDELDVEDAEFLIGALSDVVDLAVEKQPFFKVVSIPFKHVQTNLKPVLKDLENLSEMSKIINHSERKTSKGKRITKNSIRPEEIIEFVFENSVNDLSSGYIKSSTCSYIEKRLEEFKLGKFFRPEKLKSLTSLRSEHYVVNFSKVKNSVDESLKDLESFLKKCEVATKSLSDLSKTLSSSLEILSNYKMVLQSIDTLIDVISKRKLTKKSISSTLSAVQKYGEKKKRLEITKEQIDILKKMNIGSTYRKSLDRLKKISQNLKETVEILEKDYQKLKLRIEELQSFHSSNSANVMNKSLLDLVFSIPKNVELSESMKRNLQSIDINNFIKGSLRDPWALNETTDLSCSNENLEVLCRTAYELQTANILAIFKDRVDPMEKEDVLKNLTKIESKLYRLQENKLNDLAMKKIEFEKQYEEIDLPSERTFKKIDYFFDLEEKIQKKFGTIFNEIERLKKSFRNIAV